MLVISMPYHNGLCRPDDSGVVGANSGCPILRLTAHFIYYAIWVKAMPISNILLPTLCL